MNFGVIMDLLGLLLFSFYVGAAVFTKDDLKEIKYLAWASVVLLATMFTSLP